MQRITFMSKAHIAVEDWGSALIVALQWPYVMSLEGGKCKEKDAVIVCKATVPINVFNRPITV